MRLVCPKCSSQYEVDISLFPDEGREVQCSNCEEIWFQYPVEEEKPLRLDTRADEDSEVDFDEPRPARPSQRLKEDEQRDLAAAVQEEIAAREEQAERAADRPRTRRKIERSVEPVAEDEILSQLRQEIAKEGGDFESSGPTKSSKRNLEKAAENAGISVGVGRSDSGQGSEHSSDGGGGDDAPRRWRKSRRREKKQKSDRQSRRGNLASALRDIEATDQRSSMGFRHGFLTAVIVAMIGSGVYMFQDDIAQSYPPTAPWLEQFDNMVVQGRAQAQLLYVEYQPVVQDLIDQASAAVGDLTSGGEGAAE